MDMCKILVCVLLLFIGEVKGEHSLTKRVLPTNENCDPQSQVCRKGDWIATSIADCHYTGFFSCDARNDVFYSWTVDVAKGDKCQPVSGKRFRCGEAGTNTRCVCSDYKVWINNCRCQYWPAEDPGASSSAPCKGYYTGGTSSLHHWACCNNCDDSDDTCDGVPWQGGSSSLYCDNCGQNAGGGRVKYYFNCGSCSQQRECSDYCSGPIRNLPGLCWQWLDCFKGCCLARAQQPSQSKRQTNEPASFCGDGTCDTGESSTTCPIDCCYQVNSACAEDACDLQCCGEPSCCLDESSLVPAPTNNFVQVTLATWVLCFFTCLQVIINY